MVAAPEVESGRSFRAFALKANVSTSFTMRPQKEEELLRKKILKAAARILTRIATFTLAGLVNLIAQIHSGGKDTPNLEYGQIVSSFHD